MLNYEDALVGAAAKRPIYINVVEDLAWCEIDDENHLQRAVTMVFPKITKRVDARLRQ